MSMLMFGCPTPNSNKLNKIELFAYGRQRKKEPTLLVQIHLPFNIIHCAKHHLINWVSLEKSIRN